MKWLDSHCHPHFWIGDNTDDSVDLIQTAQQLEAMLMVSVEPKDAEILKRLASKAPNLHWSVGIHPCHCDELDDLESYDELFQQYSDCHAIGESGLDRFHNSDPASLRRQSDFFEYHLHQAKILKKPLIVHTRQASTETLEFLKSHRGIRGVIHCFTESLEFARSVLDLGWMISFSGILTFPKAHELRTVASFVPQDRILIETDAPYLAPSPVRGKPNRPEYVQYIGSYLAQLRGLSEENLKEILWKNYSDFLSLNI